MNVLKINDVKIHIVNVPRNTGFVCQHAILELYTNEGLVGIGEMSDFSHLPTYSINVSDLRIVLKKLLIGIDPFEIELINKKMLDAFPETMYYYEKGSFIRCGVDIALHDLIGKKLGVNISNLLGGRYREKIKVCYPIFRHLEMNEVEGNIEIVRKKFKEGFDVFRLYAGKNPDADEEFLKGIRSEFGSKITIKSLDFSHLLNWKKALKIVRRLEKYDVKLVESPAPRNDFQGLNHFRMRTELPVSDHVWSFKELEGLIMHDSLDVFNIAPIFIGGITQAKKAAHAVEVVGKDILVGTTQELSYGTAVQGAFGASIQNLNEISDPTGPRLYTEDVTKTPIEYKDGYLILPDKGKPGVGMDIDWDKVKSLSCDNFSWENTEIDSLQDRTKAKK